MPSPCRSPYCECPRGECSHPDCYDVRGSDPVRLHYDLTTHIYRQIAFSFNTFGPGPRTLSTIDHITKELQEIKAEPFDLYEWIDVMLLSIDGAWRSGHSPEQIVEALRKKLEINENREWPDWRTAAPGKAITHKVP